MKLAMVTLLCTVVCNAAAHEIPPATNSVLLLGSGESVEVAFLADCSGPQNDSPVFISREQRMVAFTLVVSGATPGASGEEFEFPIELRDGESFAANLPADTYGRFLDFDIDRDSMSGWGVCGLKSALRTIDSSGTTVDQRAFSIGLAPILDEYNW